MVGAPEPVIAVPTICKIEFPGEAEPFMESSARMGGVFLHGAACTIHKSQGSQWPTVQIFGPDLTAASKSGMIEAELPLWNASPTLPSPALRERLVWVHNAALALPSRPLDTSDLDAQASLGLEPRGA